jgi:hypothetical protein
LPLRANFAARTFAQRFFVASMIRFRPAALSLRFFRKGVAPVDPESEVGAVGILPPPAAASCCRITIIFLSISAICVWNPINAAFSSSNSEEALPGMTKLYSAIWKSVRRCKQGRAGLH